MARTPASRTHKLRTPLPPGDFYPFRPRSYQRRLLQAFSIDLATKRPRTRHGVCVWHRRSGKDATAMLGVALPAIALRPGNYFHIMPYFSQARRAIWQEEASFLDRIPPHWDPKRIGTEMFVELTIPGGGKRARYFLLGADDTATVSKLVGSNPLGVIYSEAAQIDRSVRSLLFPVLAENGGWELFVSTPRGKNWFHDLYRMAVDAKDWFSELLTVDHTVKDAKAEDGSPMPGEHGGSVIPLEEIAAARQSGMTEEEIQQEFYCFPPRTHITTNRGQVPIEQIVVGDVVLTHAGRWRAVRKVYQRDYAGELISLRTKGHFRAIECTPEHPLRVLNPSTQTYEWKPAKAIQPQEFMVLPRMKHGINTAAPELVRVLCWYVTEGSVSQTSVQFSLGLTELKEERDLLDDLKILGIEAIAIQTPTSRAIHAKSARLADLCVRSCGSGSANKRVPWDLIGGHELTAFNTLMAGDGMLVCSGKEQPFWRYTTTSYHLAHDIQLLASLLGYRSGIRSRRGGASVIEGRTVACKPSYSIDVYMYGEPTHILPAKHGIGVRVSSVKRIPYDGPVYNLGVSIDESYVAEGRVVHNCSWEGYAVGTIYGDLIQQARKDGRIGRCPHDPAKAVGVITDLGRSNMLAMWFYQVHGSEIRFVDYHAARGMDTDSCIAYLLNLPYAYGRIVLPHDGAHETFNAPDSVLMKFRKRFRAEIAVAQKTPMHLQINAVRSKFPRFVFDEGKCGRDIGANLPSGLDALGNYRRKWDDEKRAFSNEPVHDKFSDGASAMATGMCAWREGLEAPEPESERQTVALTDFDPMTYEHQQEEVYAAH